MYEEEGLHLQFHVTHDKAMLSEKLGLQLLFFLLVLWNDVEAEIVGLLSSLVRQFHSVETLRL